MGATDIPLRPTGLMERFMIVRNHVKCYNNVAVTATYTISSSILKSSDRSGVESLLASILAEILNKHPLMGVALEDETATVPKWKRLQSFNVKEVLKIVEAAHELDSCDTWLQDEHVAQFDDVRTKPLWRVSARVNGLSDTKRNEFKIDVSFFMHHAIGDGMSGAAFHLSFLEALNDIVTGQTKSTTPSDGIISVKAQPLPASLEEITPLPLTVRFILTLLIRQFIYNPADPTSWTGPPAISASQARPVPSQHRSFSLPAASVQTLLTRCRHEQTTLTALLNTLIAQKLALMHPSYTTFTALTPFNMRKFAAPDTVTNQTMGCYVTGLFTKFSSANKLPRGQISCSTSTSPSDSASQSLWTSARAAKEDIVRGAASPANQTVGMLKFIANDLANFFLGKLGKEREGSFEVSNIGAVDGGVSALNSSCEKSTTETPAAGANGNSGPAKAVFDRIVFSAAGSIYASPYVFTVVSVKGGALSVMLNYEEGVVSAADASEMVTWLEGRLKAIVGEEN